MLKFFDEQRTQILKAETREMGFWTKMKHTARVQEVCLGKALLMPFAITAKYNSANKTVSWNTECWDLIKSCVSEENKSTVEKALSNTGISPEAALEAACLDLVKYNVLHGDIKWRHVALIASYDKGLFGFGMILGGFKLRLVPGFIDFGMASMITRENREEALKEINSSKNDLMSKLVIN
jgi:hypothetical protein